MHTVCVPTWGGWGGGCTGEPWSDLPALSHLKPIFLVVLGKFFYDQNLYNELTLEFPFFLPNSSEIWKAISYYRGKLGEEEEEVQQEGRRKEEIKMIYCCIPVINTILLVPIAEPLPCFLCVETAYRKINALCSGMSSQCSQPANCFRCKCTHRITPITSGIWTGAQPPRK